MRSRLPTLSKCCLATLLNLPAGQAASAVGLGTRSSSGGLHWALLCATLWLASCASTSTQRAPVEDRTTPPRAVGVTAPAPAAGASDPGAAAGAAADGKPVLPGAENAGKPGYYSVKPGDTLIRIGLDNGQNWRDIRRWNDLADPNKIEVGQVLRVVPPNVDAEAVTARGVAGAKVEVRPLDGKAAATANAAPEAAAAASAPSAAVVAVASDENLNWLWPAASAITGSFEEGKSKGIVFAGKAGDPVLAAADGRVVYAGDKLRGYGNLLIIKHNTTYLSAYAHNQALLVKEDQVVRRGQKIAEMGASDADRVQLHFEIRRLGKPVDPTKLLPTR